MSAVAAPPASLSPPPAGPRPFRWTREEYYRLGELGLFNGRRVELIRGEIIVMSPMNEPHVRGVILTLEALRVVFATGFTLRPQAPLDFGDAAPEPDLAVVPGGPRDHPATPSSALLVVEIADTSLDYDTTTKAELYATAGVPEYWVLDLTGQQLHVFRDPAPLPAGLGATAYRTRLTFGPDEVVTPLSGVGGVRVADLLP